MAIDTKAKRASVQAYLLGLMRPPPDGTVAAADRAAVGWFYAGIAYAAAVVVTTLHYTGMVCNVGRLKGR